MFVQAATTVVIPRYGNNDAEAEAAAPREEDDPIGQGAMEEGADNDIGNVAEVGQIIHTGQEQVKSK